jgi:hypothetical protein
MELRLMILPPSAPNRLILLHGENRPENVDVEVEVKALFSNVPKAPKDNILQLADVARPIRCVEEFDPLLVYVSNLLAQFLGVAVDQVSDQQGSIANALAQCRQSNRKNVEAVK